MPQNNTTELALTNHDQNLAAYLEMLKTRPRSPMWFQLSDNATKEDVETAVQTIEVLRSN